MTMREVITKLVIHYAEKNYQKKAEIKAELEERSKLNTMLGIFYQLGLLFSIK